MCGIIGVWSPTTEENLEVLLKGIKYLHRRGPEGKGAGFINPFTRKISSTRANTKNSLLHFERTVKGLAYDTRARMSLGQTRYITDDRYPNKSELEANTQPIHLYYDGLEGLCDEVIGVHNGHIRHKHLIKSQIVPSALSIATVDSRYLIELIMQMRRQLGNDRSAIDWVMKELVRIDGAASVGFSSGTNLVAFRDPKGYRPLVYGHILDSRVFVSESGFFDEMAAIFGRDRVRFERSLDPGEILIIDMDGGLETEILQDLRKTGGRHSPCSFEDIYIKDRMSRDNTGRVSVASIRNKIGSDLAKFYQDDLTGIDIVVPVVKSGLSYAQGFAFAARIPYRELLTKPSINGSEERYFLLTKSEKKHHYVVDALEVLEKSIAVIDDSIVRGETLISIYAALKDAGAGQIKFFSCWPPKFFQCDYGVDTKRKELIAYKLVEEGLIKYSEGDPVKYDIHHLNLKVTELVRKLVKEKYGNAYAGVDDLSVFYIPLDLLRKNLTTCEQCLYCVTGERS